MILTFHSCQQSTLTQIKFFLIIVAWSSPQADRWSGTRVGNRKKWRVNTPDGHARARNAGQLDGTRETLVTLGVIILQTNLQLNGLKEVTLLLVERVVEQLIDILAHSG